MNEKKERALTAKEQARKIQFDRTVERLVEEGYEKTEITFGVAEVNVLAFVVMMPFAIVFSFIYYVMNDDFFILLTPRELVTFLVGVIVLMVIHELIHGIIWLPFVKNGFHSIEFGVIWKMVTPYCCCKEPLTKLQYILGGAMPTIVLGFGLALGAAIMGNEVMMLLAIVMIFGGGGDLMMIGGILRHKSKGKEVLVLDHPTDIGCIILEKASVSVSVQ